MLVPAALYKEQIAKEFQKLYYTTDMLYETGSTEQWCPEIANCPESWQFQYAIVDNNNKLIGYLAYVVDYYCSKAYNFGLISFDKGNVILGRDLFNKMEELVSTLHKIEWRMVGGNPVERSYDKFCFKHNGKKHILKDSIRDAQGNYRDDIIYEIINER